MAGPSLFKLAAHGAALGYMYHGWASLQHLGGPMAHITNDQYAGHWAFLTILGLWASGFTIGAGVLAELTGLEVFRLIKRTLLLISLPVETVISTVYWTLILTMPSLMLPGGPAGDDSTPGQNPTPPTLFFIPLSIDLALHLTPCVVLLVDFFWLEKPYRRPASTWGAFGLASLCGVSYGLWAEWCAVHNEGVFAYPFLTIAPPVVRASIYTCATAGALGLFWVLNGLKSRK